MVFFLILPISWGNQSGHDHYQGLTQQRFSLCFWETQPNFTCFHSENCCKDPFPDRTLGEHVTVSTALPDFFIICYLSSLSRPFLAYHHRTYGSSIIVRKPAVVCSHLKLSQFSWNKAEKTISPDCLICLLFCVWLKYLQKFPYFTKKKKN